jgi:very-short-patch-repair endonuclease
VRWPILGVVWEELAATRSGILTRKQALVAGLTDEAIEAQVSAARWQRVYPGVLATFSGPLSREAQLWAAVLSVGTGAVLSHETAAELLGLIDGSSEVVHVTVPVSRNVRPRPGIVLHRSRNVERLRHPVLEPPRTRLEETVIDLTQTSPDLDAAIGWLVKAVASRRTTAARLLAAVTARHRVRWRRDLISGLSDVAEGCHSMLELRYARRVERGHRLPRGDRQHKRDRWYDDVAYTGFGVLVELDGRAAHAGEGVFRDHRRDNAAVISGAKVLRYGLADVTRRPCAVAAEVAAVLRAAGWAGRPRDCGPGCALPHRRG